jgi:hypothetical protein
VCGGADPPNGVPDIICHQHSAMAIQRHPYRAAARLPIGIEESGHHVHRWAIRLTLGERDEDHPVATGRAAVPGTVLTDEGARDEGRRQAAVSR